MASDVLPYTVDPNHAVFILYFHDTLILLSAFLLLLYWVPIQGSKLTFLLGNTGAPNVKKLEAPAKKFGAPTKNV